MIACPTCGKIVSAKVAKLIPTLRRAFPKDTPAQTLRKALAITRS